MKPLQKGFFASKVENNFFMQSPSNMFRVASTAKVVIRVNHKSILSSQQILENMYHPKKEN